MSVDLETVELLIPLESDSVSLYYGDGNFDFIRDMYFRKILENAHWAITQCELWNWLSKSNEESFLFSDSPMVYRIRITMIEHPIGKSHSGVSFAMAMRQMEYIAKNGIDLYRSTILHSGFLSTVEVPIPCESSGKQIRRIDLIR